MANDRPEGAVGRKKTNSLNLVDTRISEQARDLARTVAGFTGESIPEYLTRLVMAHGPAERDRLHAAQKAREEEARAAEPPEPRPRRREKGGHEPTS